MYYNVRLFYNTGFNQKNIPDSPTLLDSATFTDVEGVYLNQNNDISQITINGEWNGCRNIDYVRVGDTPDPVFYFVTNVSMQADNVVTLSLMLDPITTINITQMEFIDGWCSRRIIPQSQQSIANYQENIIGENWSPTNEFIFETDLPLHFYSPPKNFVLSTVDLLQTQKIADEYKTDMASGSTQSVIIPKLMSTNDFTNFFLSTQDNKIGGITSGAFKYPNSALYDFDKPKVKEGIANVRSLGVESAILGSYQIPANWITVSYDSANPEIVSTITGSSTTYISTLNYEYASNVENKKVFALYNNYTVTGVTSGDSMAYQFSQIFDNTTSPQFLKFADPTPNGMPYCRPVKYYGKNNGLMGIVKGSNWLNNQLAFVNQSGALINQRNLAMGARQHFSVVQAQNENRLASDVNNIGTSALGMGSNIASTGSPTDILPLIGGISSGISTLNNTLMYYNMSNAQNLNYAQQIGQAIVNQNLYAPDIMYPYQTSLQSYLPNDFMIGRYRLTEEDVRRFDNYLHRYGEAVDEPFKKEFMFKKQNYDYIQTSNILLKTNMGVRYNQLAEDVFNNGVRIWHTLPSTTALQTGNNPDRS